MKELQRDKDTEGLKSAPESARRERVKSHSESHSLTYLFSNLNLISEQVCSLSGVLGFKVGLWRCVI